MKSRKYSSFITILALLLLAGTTLESCAKLKRLVMGDPRKNCNHPKHGDFVREKRMKKQGY